MAAPARTMLLLASFCTLFGLVQGFYLSPGRTHAPGCSVRAHGPSTFARVGCAPFRLSRQCSFALFSESEDDTEVADAVEETPSEAATTSDHLLLGVAGTVAALIVFVSEFTLKTTGCGLPAGPLGLFGAAEGVSYLGIVGIAGYSLFTKFRTGSGLPAGPFGILGAAEGLSFLAMAAGLVVLGFQIADYGYIPNAVPMEGGMCT